MIKVDGKLNVIEIKLGPSPFVFRKPYGGWYPVLHWGLLFEAFYSGCDMDCIILTMHKEQYRTYDRWKKKPIHIGEYFNGSSNDLFLIELFD